MPGIITLYGITCVLFKVNRGAVNRELLAVENVNSIPLE